MLYVGFGSSCTRAHLHVRSYVTDPVEYLCVSVRVLVYVECTRLSRLQISDGHRGSFLSLPFMRNVCLHIHPTLTCARPVKYKYTRTQCTANSGWNCRARSSAHTHTQKTRGASQSRRGRGRLARSASRQVGTTHTHTHAHRTIRRMAVAYTAEDWRR